MFIKMIKTVVLGCLFVLLGVSLVFSENPAYWNLEEGADDVNGYAYDSGSFSLEDGFEFTKIWVEASVEDGYGFVEMTAEAYIEVGSWDVYVEASATVEDTPSPVSAETNGTGSCEEWYWIIDTRNNIGTGSAWCKWRWIND